MKSKKGKMGMKSMKGKKSHKYWHAYDDDSWGAKKGIKGEKYNYYWYTFDDDSWRVRKLEDPKEEQSEGDRDLQNYYGYYEDPYYGDVSYYQDTYYEDNPYGDVSYYQDTYYEHNPYYGPEPHDAYDDYFSLPICPPEPTYSPAPVYVPYPKYVSIA